MEEDKPTGMTSANTAEGIVGQHRHGDGASQGAGFL